MTVKDVLAQAAFLLDREKLVAYLKSETNDFSQEELTSLQREADGLLRCFNIVENEIALDYLPLTAEASFENQTGEVPYTSFTRSPVSVLAVTDERGNKLPYTIFPEYVKTVKGTVSITYTYAPESKAISGNSDYSGRVSARLMAYGVASEYCLISGLYDEALSWDKKYKDALLCACASNKPHVIRSRRWV